MTKQLTNDEITYINLKVQREFSRLLKKPLKQVSAQVRTTRRKLSPDRARVIDNTFA